MQHKEGKGENHKEGNQNTIRKQITTSSSSVQQPQLLLPAGCAGTCCRRPHYTSHQQSSLSLHAPLHHLPLQSPSAPFFLPAEIVPTLWAGTGLLVASNTREAGSRSKQAQHASQMFPSLWNPKYTSPWKQWLPSPVSWHTADTKPHLPILTVN